MSGWCASFSGSENARGTLKCLAAASAESWRVVQTAVISNSGSACNAGIWAIEANPRCGLAPTIPTRILLPVAIKPSRKLADDHHALRAPSHARHGAAGRAFHHTDACQPKGKLGRRRPYD